MDWMTLAAAGIGALSSIVGGVMQQQGAAEARKVLEQAKELFGAVNIPDLSDIEAMVSSAEFPDRTAFEDIAPEDPKLAAAQDASIEALGEWTRPEVTDAERAMYARALGEIQRRNASDRAALVRDTGGYGSGQALELGRRAQADRGALESDIALQGNAQAQARALQALRSRYQMASDRSSEQYRRGANLAQAKDALARINAGWQLDRANMLAGMRMKPTELELAKARGMAGLSESQAASTRDSANQLGGQIAGGGAAFGRGLYYAGRGTSQDALAASMPPKKTRNPNRTPTLDDEEDYYT